MGQVKTANAEYAELTQVKSALEAQFREVEVKILHTFYGFVIIHVVLGRSRASSESTG